MIKIFLHIFIFTLSSCALFNPNPNHKNILSDAPLELKPFTSDYCSDFPEGTKKNPKLWADCCFSHDLRYWIGGTEKERRDSDLVLKECVKKSGSNFDAFLMYIGVRMGGKPGNASYSWGYGWNIKQDYSQISEKDIERSKILLKNSEYYKNENTQKLINDFIKSY